MTAPTPDGLTPTALVTEASTPAPLTPERLEETLGDPYDDDNPYGFAAAVARDEADAFPEDLCAALRGTGFHLAYLPQEWGGSFETFDHSIALVRAAARRDVNVMPGTMFSIIAATCLQIHGSPEQRERVAAVLREGGAVAFALSEAEHGSDLLAGEVRLADDGTLHGEKWMVGNGSRCSAVYVVARTGERGPGAFSSFLLDLAGLPAESGGLTRAPSPRTGGMRGMDFAHLRFAGLPVPEDARVGRAGEGLEVAIKAQQAVRLMSMAGSLGIADSALRLALDFAVERRFGRAVLSETPYARRDLAAASAALIAADAVALAASRGVHALPEAFSVWGPAAKHVVAEASEELVRRCGAVLATRSVLRAGAPGSGLFQKLQRDAQVVRVIDASPLANLRSYAGQIRTLAAGGAEVKPDVLESVFSPGAPLPPYRPALFDLVTRGADPVLGGLGPVADAVGEALRGDEGPTAALVAELAGQVAVLPALTERATARGADPNELVDLAERYAWLHGAAACLRLWWANRDRSLYGAAPGSPGWLGAALGYLLARADGVDPRRRGSALSPALDAALALRERNRMFTALPVVLAARRAAS
ncbi:acyl-CoA dehydrogenase family protein [Streptomyces sp. NPDC054884]|uniref:acyl-CoA dehydrogenase family protein n=1 Tax=Streptomyces sp. ME08-AFT2 TaxID=3028683 RepID=UPI0029A30B89|nr:acyl-CoA dehydrogenase family protein [Streptomyces sp. ME08-AFT2]MDX3308670.1 acyl-CoA dehydrogenase family protein [Streptomyces sp. ME08-AFT2]